jgi:hypothetical protein
VTAKASPKKNNPRRKSGIRQRRATYSTGYPALTQAIVPPSTLTGDAKPRARAISTARALRPPTAQMK